MPGSASVLVPTRARPAYLDVALRSIMPQANALGAEVIVVSDGADAGTRDTAARHGATVLTLPARSGANAARNAGISAATGDLIVLTDDDVQAPDGWLAALLGGAEANPGVDVFGGPIRALLEGGGPPACGREAAPITTLDLGTEDADVRYVWSANMAVRADAFAAAGPFDERIRGRGEEEEWLERYARQGGRVRYLAHAGLHHRRSESDSTIQALARSQLWLGRTARRNDVRKGCEPTLARELLTLGGSSWHALRRRCSYGFVFAAHSWGRVAETIATRRAPSKPSSQRAVDRDGDFLSGESGEVWGVRATTRAVIRDAVADALDAATLLRHRLRGAARSHPARDVLVFGVERTDAPNLMADARAELLGSRHRVEMFTAPVGALGKFQNLNALLAAHPPGEHDWLLVVDDDVALPADFLDGFLFLAERFDLRLAQPAHRHRSHAAWRVTRRRMLSVLRETAFVETGPVFAFHRSTFELLLPFADQRFGWGLDLHWSALALERHWRLGIVDATPIRHGLRRIAAAYDRSAAIEESREYLRDRPYVPAAQAQRTLLTHRSW